MRSLSRIQSRSRYEALLYFFFFFQAEDGIRDYKVTGVQTCALPISNDFISEWIGKNFTRPIQEAAHEVLGGPLSLKFHVMPQLFDGATMGQDGTSIADAPQTDAVAVHASAAQRTVHRHVPMVDSPAV